MEWLKWKNKKSVLQDFESDKCQKCETKHNVCSISAATCEAWMTDAAIKVCDKCSFKLDIQSASSFEHNLICYSHVGSSFLEFVKQKNQKLVTTEYDRMPSRNSIVSEYMKNSKITRKAMDYIVNILLEHGSLFEKSKQYCDTWFSSLYVQHHFSEAV